MPLPDTEMGLVIRTDFSDQTAWEAVQVRLSAGYAKEYGGLGEDVPMLTLIEDQAYACLTPDQASRLVDEADDIERPVLFLADGATMSTVDQTLLVVT